MSQKLEMKCMEAFKLGNKRDAEQMLPSILQPADVRTTKLNVPAVGDGLWWFSRRVSLVHLAAYHGWIDVVVDLFTKYKSDPNCKDSDGCTPLLYAATRGHLDVARYLVNEHCCDPMTKDRDSWTTLHLACRHGHLEIAKYLIDELHCNPANCENKYCITPLHRACSHGHLNITNYLINEVHCNPSCANTEGETPLHLACRRGHLDITKYLVDEVHCNPSCKDRIGNTPLHHACGKGHTHIAQYLLSTSKVNPLVKNDYGETPVDLAGRGNSYDLLKMFQAFPQCKKDFPVHTYTKLILTGHGGAGKTTISQLVLLLATRATGIFSMLSTGCVTNVECLTAGIVPLHVESKVKEVGNLVIYDFAGQQEYYSSHAAVLERIMVNSAAIFVCIVDVRQCIEKISESLQYWMSFMENACSLAQGSSHVIVVGSHADQVKSSLELRKKSLLMESIAESRVKQLIYGGFIAMDCRMSKTREAHRFCTLLSTSQQAILSSQPSMTLYCHILYAFLRTKLKKAGCKLLELISDLTSDIDSSLDCNINVLTESLICLSDKGLIVFLQNKDNIQSSWVVIEKETLLKEVNGKLFAPESFNQYHEVASNTGIMPIRTLEELFPHHNSEMLMGYLESMEFCHPIASLALQRTNLGQNIKGSALSLSDATYLFFPSLVKECQPENLPSPKFGWCLGCHDRHQFYSNRFLHVLLLRLAFTFTLASKHLPPSSSLCDLERQCKVWRNGIVWKSVSGVSTIVEVVDHNRWVIVLVSEKSKKAAEICSSVIRMILDLQQQLCSDVNTCECLISPTLLNQYPFDTLSDTDLFDLPTVARSMLLRHKVLLDRKEGTNEFSTEEALSYEPYYLLQPSSVFQLYKESTASQPVPDSLLQDVLRYCQLPCEPQNHKELREYVNKQSIFTGRNPLEVADLKENDFTSHVATTATTLSTTVSDDLSKSLSMEDLVDVLEVVECVSDWKRLGLTLRLSYQPTLTDIETYRRGKPDECKIDMLSAWLQQQDNVGVPSWSALKAALKRMGENKIADKIGKQ